ncbi:MAG: helix-turn-helix domain-containing protein [Desulfobacteraceae bacterium]|nr:helix-turn-helix domain-containing protein [Desulfobacteraceae bacterium]
MTRVTFWAGHECLFSGIACLKDALVIANLWNQTINGEAASPLFETQILTTNGKAVNAFGNMKIQPDGCLEHSGSTDLILIPPFLPHIESQAEDIDTVLAWIVSCYENGVPIGAMCTGTFILAETGLLDGRIATTNWQFVRMFQRKYPKVNLMPERVVTHDNGLICSGAAMAVLNLALYVIKMFGSQELASACSKALLVDPSRNTQTPYILSEIQKSHGDLQILQAQLWMEKNYTEKIFIDDIARAVGISQRHFKRRFKKATGMSPLGCLQHIRIEAAKKKLETTQCTIDEITWQIGYQDSSFFRKLFKKFTTLSPKEYRSRFKVGAPDYQE